jgi:hypothetical protein
LRAAARRQMPGPARDQENADDSSNRELSTRPCVESRRAVSIAACAGKVPEVVLTPVSQRTLPRTSPSIVGLVGFGHPLRSSWSKRVESI